MEFCVIGLGRFGSAIAQTLARKGHEVLAIDRDEGRVQELEDKVSQALVLDATNEKALKSLGLKDFDWVIIAMSQDIEASILSTMLVKEAGAKKVLAKASSDVHAKILKRIGADRVIFPEREMGQKVAESLSSPRIFDYIELSPEYSIVEIVAPKSFQGKTIKQTEARTKYGIHIIAIKRKKPEMENESKVTARDLILVAPDPNEEILQGDLLVILGKIENIEKVKELK
ncbi:MAG TPA: TrkA family potassium uptake protein [candidate division WOR-3 bacterium]|uniref:TrkA family potassium uptake protein n=1 Tax=candidate division WOR-3 bacterium TaxID=2052148 RepID=A0A7C0XAS0_UNCW3|nr:MAG: TrkA family potassium uptake protein [Candidatus Hydrothermae bacterium]HDM90062.1 TrkA family potassium uptake protein [candidate division WOR-3 bacterium]